jgi:hypothetical protein
MVRIGVTQQRSLHLEHQSPDSGSRFCLLVAGIGFTKSNHMTALLDPVGEKMSCA